MQQTLKLILISIYLNITTENQISLNATVNARFKIMTTFLDKALMNNLVTNTQKKVVMNQVDYLLKNGQTKDQIKTLTKEFFKDFLKEGNQMRFKDTSQFGKVTAKQRSTLGSSTKLRSKEDEPAEAKEQPAEGEQAEKNASANSISINPAESGEAAAAGPPKDMNLAKQLLNENKNQTEGDYPVGDLKADTDKDLTAPEGQEDKVSDLATIPKPKVMDRPFTPDIMQQQLKLEMYPDEFQGFENFRVWRQAEGKLLELNSEKAAENKIFFSPNQFEMRLDEITILNTKSLYSSCKVFDAIAICSVKDKSSDEAFKAKVEQIGLDAKSTQIIYLESLEGNQIFQIADPEVTEYLRALTLFHIVQNPTKMQKYLMEGGGTCTVDSNAGSININYVTASGDEVQDVININSITSIAQSVDKSQVDLDYTFTPPAASDPLPKNIRIEVVKNPEGVLVSDPSNEFWQAYELYKSIDGAMNLYYQFQIAQKKDVFLTGIEDLKSNQESKKLSLLYSQKYPLKLMKQIENQMQGELKCIQKASIIVYIAELLAAQNPFITAEILYFYQVKNVFPSVNPTFEGVEQQNWLKFFKIQEQVDDGHGEINIRHASVTSGIAHRFLYQINERICAVGKEVTLPDYIDILGQSAKHFDWKTNPTWAPYRDQISSFVPHVKKPDEGKICTTIKGSLLRSALVQPLALKDQVQLLINMMESQPRTVFYVLDQLVTNLKDSIGEPGLAKLSEGISGSFPGQELTDDVEGLNALMKIIHGYDLKKLFIMKDAPIGQFKNLMAGASTISANIQAVLGELDSTISSTIAIEIIKSFKDPYYSLGLQLLDTNKKIVEEKPDDPLNKIRELASDSKKALILLKDGDCKLIEDIGVKKFCDELTYLRDRECPEEEIKAMADMLDPPKEIATEDISAGETGNAILAECDAAVLESLSNLSEEELRTSIKNTYNAARKDESMACQLPKIQIGQLAMIKDSIKEEQAQSLMETQASFAQVHSHSQSKSKSSEFIRKAQMFGADKDHSTCKPQKLKEELNMLLEVLDLTTMKKSLCSAMSFEPWRKMFAEQNAALYDEMAGSLQFPWWPLIPPMEVLEDEGNWADISTQLSCNHQCLSEFVFNLMSAGTLSAPIAIKAVETSFKEIGEDVKTEIDFIVEKILSKDADESTKFSEILNLEVMSPHTLRALGDLFSKLNQGDSATALTTLLKANEMCTRSIDDFYKMKSLDRPMKTNAESLTKAFIEVENQMVRKLLINRFMKCQSMDAAAIDDLIGILNADEKQPENVKFMLGKESIDPEERIKLVTETEEYVLNFDENLLKFVEKHLSTIKDEKMTCVWNNLVECGCVMDTLKSVDFDLLGSINDEVSAEDQSLAGDQPLSEAEMREVILSCSESVDFGATKQGTVATKCLTDEDKISLLFNKVIEVTGELPEDLKVEFEGIISGAQTNLEKVNMIMSNKMANTEPEYSIFKEKVKEQIESSELTDLETITCIYQSSMEVPPLEQCAMAAMKGTIDCKKNPEACEQVLVGETCEEIQLDSACTPETLKLLATFDNNSTVKDPKVTMTDEDCMYDGAKAPTIKSLMEKSEHKLELFDLRGNIKECALRKIEEEAGELEELASAIDALKANGEGGDGEGGIGGEGGKGGEGGEGGLEDMTAMMKDMENNVASAINFMAADVIKENLDAAAAALLKKAGKSDANEESEAGGEGEGKDGIVEDKSAFDVTKEKDSYLAGPDNMPRSKNDAPLNAKAVFKAKQICDLNQAFVFDEQMAECKKKGLCDHKETKAIRLEYINLVKAMDEEMVKITPADPIELIMSKIDLVGETIKPYTGKDDFGGSDDAQLDFTHDNLQRICDTQGIVTSCISKKVEPGFRFVQKFLPEEIVKPDDKDYRVMIILTEIYRESIMNKPVFVLSIHNKLKKVEGKVQDLSENLSEGEDVSFITDRQRGLGLIELAIGNKFKSEVGNAMASAIPAMKGTVEEKKAMLDKVLNVYIKVLKTVNSMPCIAASIMQFGIPPAYPPLTALETGFENQLKLKKGVIPPSDFWVMNKIRNTDPKMLDKQPTQVNMLQASLTVKRFMADGLVFRSLDVIKGIQKSLKGHDYSRNFIRDVGQIQMMSKGDGFLDQVEVRQMAREAKALKKIEDEKEKERKAANPEEKDEK